MQRALTYLSGEVPCAQVVGPASMNGRGYAIVKRFLEGLRSYRIRAKMMYLDTCFSAAFVPLMRDLLTEDGHIMGYICAEPNWCMLGLPRLLAAASLHAAFTATLAHESTTRGEMGLETQGPLVQVLFA